jgi:hypothetical protein
MLVRGWVPTSRASPTIELQAAHTLALQQQQGDRRGALAGTKRTRGAGSSSQSFFTLEQVEESKRRMKKLGLNIAQLDTETLQAALPMEDDAVIDNAERPDESINEVADAAFSCEAGLSVTDMAGP